MEKVKFMNEVKAYLESPAGKTLAFIFWESRNLNALANKLDPEDGKDGVLVPAIMVPSTQAKHHLADTIENLESCAIKLLVTQLGYKEYDEYAVYEWVDEMLIESVWAPDATWQFRITL
jgi:hypothetical protein